MKKEYINEIAWSKILVFLRAVKEYTLEKNASVKTLLKQFFGWQEQELNGENCPRNTEFGTVYSVDLMPGLKRKYGRNYLNFAHKILIWNM